jgi:hypothetical protein
MRYQDDLTLDEMLELASRHIERRTAFELLLARTTL